MDVLYGSYVVKRVRCPVCGAIRTQHEEKMTDVNIACQLLSDAIHNRFDTAFVLSGDSDLVPPIQMIRNQYEDRIVFSLFPPGRVSKELKQTSHGFITINESDLKKTQLPSVIIKKDASILYKPDSWH